MRKLLVPVFCALALAACTGGQKQNNGGQTADAESIMVGDSAEMTEITYKILKENLRIEQMTGSPVAMDKITDKAEPFNNREYSGRNFRFFVRDDGNFSLYWYNYFFPKKSGGYDIIVVATNAGGDAYEPTYEYSRFAYSNGQLTRADKIINLSINDFYSNADQFPEAGADGIKDAIENSPCYSDIDETSLSVTFFPWNFEGDDPEEAEFVLPAVLSGFENKEGDKFPKIKFVWDGETFVRDPESKPIEEDLKYFEPAVEKSYDGNVAVKAFMFHKDINPNGLNKYLGDMGIKLSCDETTIANYVEDGDEYSWAYHVYACYPFNDGTYLALYNQEQTDYRGFDIYTLTSDGLSAYNKNPFDSDIFQKGDSDDPHAYKAIEFVSFDSEGFVVNTTDGKQRFDWNGEKFVRNNQYVDVDAESAGSDCDIQEIWRQFAEGKYDAIEPTIEGNTAEYYDSGDYYDIRIKLVSFAWDGACKVFCVVHCDDEGAETVYTLTEYNFIGGKLSKTELQPELQKYADKSEASIENGEIVFADEDVMFQWNGSTMIKKELLYNE